MKEGVISRQSNFELLRLFAIFLVIFGHCLLRTGNAGVHEPYVQNLNGILGSLLYALCVIGVNLFILISGYFGIRKVVKSVVKILIDCVVYGSIAFLIGRMGGVAENGVHSLKDLIGIINYDNWWFVASYLQLVVLSPLIERSLKDIDYNTFSYFIILLCVFNFYFSWRCGAINDHGYNITNFVFLYYIGRYLKKSEDKRWMTWTQKYGILIWVGCAFSLAAYFNFRFVHFKWNPTLWCNFWGYNIPLVMLGSVSCFAFFSHLKIQSRIINMMAMTVFGIYILHTSPYFNPIGKALTQDLYQIYGLWIIPCYALSIFVICFFISFPVEEVKRLLLKQVFPQIK